MADTFLDLEAARRFIMVALLHYTERQAPAWFTDWLNDLYVRLSEDARNVKLDELITLSRLEERGHWMLQPLAANTVYKLFGRIGRDTTGIAGY